MPCRSTDGSTLLLAIVLAHASLQGFNQGGFDPRVFPWAMEFASLWPTAVRVAMHAQVDVYAFSMIAYELFEGAIPFGHLHPVEAARRAAMNHARPTWGKHNRQA